MSYFNLLWHRYYLENMDPERSLQYVLQAIGVHVKRVHVAKLLIVIERITKQAHCLIASKL